MAPKRPPQGVPTPPNINHPSPMPPQQAPYPPAVQQPERYYYAAPPSMPQSFTTAANPNNNDPRNALDRSTDTCARIGAIVLLAIAITGFSFTVMTARSCNFLSISISNQLLKSAINDPNTTMPSHGNRVNYQQELEQALEEHGGGNRDLQLFGNLTDPPQESEAPTLSPTSLDDGYTTLTFGLFVYLDPISALAGASFHDTACSAYTDSNINYSSATDIPVNFRLARLGVVIAMISSGIASFILAVEFFLTRVWCSRVLINLGLSAALLSLPLAFAVFADSRCNPLSLENPSTNSNLGGCDLGDGSEEALIATTLFLISFVLACILPKPLPLVRVIQEMVQNQRFVYCCLCVDQLDCLCCWDSPQKHKQHGGKAANNCKDDDLSRDEETLPLSVEEHVVDEHGHSFKQYHDETAGYTLQNQYVAAYKRWLAAEKDYEDALSRFKLECGDAGVDWRKFLRKANQQTAQGTELLRESNSERPDVVLEVLQQSDRDGLDEELYRDTELLRFVDYLWTIRDNCTFAKQVMNRIQNDINEFTRLEDKRHKTVSTQSVATVASIPSSVEVDPSTKHSKSQPEVSEQVSKTSQPSDEGPDPVFFSTRSEPLKYFETAPPMECTPDESDYWSTPLFSEDFENPTSDGKHEDGTGKLEVSSLPVDPSDLPDPLPQNPNETAVAAAATAATTENDTTHHTIFPRRVREGKLMTPAGLAHLRWTDWQHPLQRYEKVSSHSQPPTTESLVVTETNSTNDP
ncbi:hypothetical protein IV203_030603 [Nitzschia inconspicua]|uniref:Uncharacterized protein n=1 Tax=Nitzschia inconspicua TaxID=303405 RepID=A0A9K3LTZ3_9STRA|nr:hypothetical protein IV203_017590 [Nitzschia inconspicua]KAG7367860.1 hypothetical protein IV203_030603 [Nitzschia inconspicua]